MNSRAALLLVATLLAALPATAATVVNGGGPKKSDCYAGFEVDGSNGLTPMGKVALKQKACNGSCTFTVQLCINEAVAGCTAAPVTSFTQTAGTALPQPAVGGSDHVCGDAQTITVPLKNGKKTGKQKIKIKTAVSGKPPKDPDTLLLICQPNPSNAGCGGGSVCGNDTVEAPEQCDGIADTACPGYCLSDCTCGSCTVPADCTNPAGGPSKLAMAISSSGDLDTGWTGVSHNFPLVVGSKLNYCLARCDASSNPDCCGKGETGDGTTNGRFFGAPLPLVSGGVPVCVVNEFNGPITLARANLQTGEMQGRVDLFSTVWTSPQTNVCPRCTGGTNLGDPGTCNAGSNRNGACTIEGIITLNSDNPPISNDKYYLSSQCPPGGVAYENVGKLDIRQPLTTGTATKVGAKLCGAAQDDGCGTGTCTQSCPGTPPLKGGINQFCCSGGSSNGTPCFPTKSGDHAITRMGSPVIPQPAWPDPTYPKTGNTVDLAAVFCIAKTTSSTVNGIAGLPGAGALIQPMSETWTK